VKRSEGAGYHPIQRQENASQENASAMPARRTEVKFQTAAAVVENAHHIVRLAHPIGNFCASKLDGKMQRNRR
jgi:hypothetical protein